jgi:3D (Asp-Asp-Asp) domain-containing protein
MARLCMPIVAACFLLASPSFALAKANDGEADTPPELPWVAAHRETGLWSRATASEAVLFRMVQPKTRFQVALPQDGPRLYVWDPDTSNYAYIEAADVGPVADPRIETRQDQARLEPRQPTAPPLALLWVGVARVTMYTCVELGGCNQTASGIWPYEGVVAVDPRLIPLGSSVWVDGLGTFLAADTGSRVRGNHVDIYVTDYARARQWGVQYLNAAAFVAP